VTHHKNAQLAYHARCILVFGIVHEGLLLRQVAKAQGISPRTTFKRLRRYRGEDEAGLLIAVPVPTSPRKAPKGLRQLVIKSLTPLALQCHHLQAQSLQEHYGPYPQDRRSPPSPDLKPKPPPQHYEQEAPGISLHLDTNKLGRFKRPGHRMTGDLSKRSR